jgi:hypothetical protein
VELSIGRPCGVVLDATCVVTSCVAGGAAAVLGVAAGWRVLSVEGAPTADKPAVMAQMQRAAVAQLAAVRIVFDTAPPNRRPVDCRKATLQVDQNGSLGLMIADVPPAPGQSGSGVELRGFTPTALNSECGVAPGSRLLALISPSQGRADLQVRAACAAGLVSRSLWRGRGQRGTSACALPSAFGI